MTDSDRTKIESLANLLGDKRLAAANEPANPEGEAVRAEADRLESLIAFYKASLAAS